MIKGKGLQAPFVEIRIDPTPGAFKLKHRIRATDMGRYLTWCGKLLPSREGHAMSAHEMYVAKNPCKACLREMDKALTIARAKGYDKHPMDR